METETVKWDLVLYIGQYSASTNVVITKRKIRQYLRILPYILFMLATSCLWCGCDTGLNSISTGGEDYANSKGNLAKLCADGDSLNLDSTYIQRERSINNYYLIIRIASCPEEQTYEKCITLRIQVNNGTTLTFEIHDFHNKRISYRQTYLAAGMHEFTIPINPGIYLFTVKTGDRIYKQKAIIC